MPKPYGAVAEVVVRGRIHGQVTNNVWHFGGNGTEFNQNNLITDLVDCINTTLKPAVSEDWAMEAVTSRLIYPSLTDPIEFVPEAVIAGTGLPAQASFVAYLIKLSTGQGGKSKRGRKFIAGAIENSVNASRLTDAALALLVQFCVCMAGKFIQSESVDQPAWELCVWSRKLSTAVGANNETGATPVRTLTPVREVASMRSRKIGHGN